VHAGSPAITIMPDKPLRIRRIIMATSSTECVTYPSYVAVAAAGFGHDKVRYAIKTNRPYAGFAWSRVAARLDDNGEWQLLESSAGMRFSRYQTIIT
jgi:hypothetical protein